ncbi:MAG: hypothetical protein ABI772_14675 [Bacteroidota bacterium]
MNIHFIIRLLVAAALTAGGYFLLSHKLPPHLSYHNFLYISIFFTVLTAFFHNGLSLSAKGGTKSFIRFYMAATAIKLFLYIGVIVIYALINKPGVMGFALCFLLHYCAFTVFEVWVSYRQFGSMKNAAIANSEGEKL